MQNLNFFSSLKLCQLLSLLFALLIFSNQAWSSVGTVVLAVGEVKIERANKVFAAKTGDAIEEKDQISTQQGARAQLKFSDNTVITLGSATDFAVEEFLGEEANKTQSAKFKVGKGAFKAITGKIGQANPDNFKLATQTATIGIRGTIFTGQISATGDKIATLSGAITVTENQTGAMVEVLAGQMTEVVAGVPPTEPRAFAAGEMDMASGEAAAENAETETGASDDEAVENLADESANRASEFAETETIEQLILQDSASILTDKNEQRSEEFVKEIAGGKLKLAGDDEVWVLIVDGFNEPTQGGGGVSIGSGWSDMSYEDLQHELPDITIDSLVDWGSLERDLGTHMAREYYVIGAYANEAAEKVSQLTDTDTTYHYSGGFKGEIKDATEQVAIISSSNLNLTINFGAEVNITGTGEFTAGDTNWNITSISGNDIDMSVEGVLTVSGTGGMGITGQMSGKFFGENLEAFGGHFGFETASGNDSFLATGVFTANQ